MNKSIFNKIILALVFFGMNMSVHSQEESRWNRLIKTVPAEVIENISFDDIKENLGVDAVGYNLLGLSFTLLCMHTLYHDYFGSFYAQNSYYSKIRQDGYESVIQFFIDNGCDIQEKTDLSVLLQESDFDPSSYQNIFKNLFPIAFMFDEAMISALVNKGLTINNADQLDILLFFAKDGKELLPLQPEEENSLNWDNVTINYDSFITFFNICDQSVQKEFLLQHPEFTAIVKK